MERGGGMAYMEEGLLQEWLEALKDLNVHVKKMFGCHCLYCDGRPVGWMSGDVFSLRETGLDYLPNDLKRPKHDDSVHEIPIPFDYCRADWLPKAVQDTADSITDI
ncbi:MAG TPA: hypothetical protein PKH23_05160 [Bacillota bacterium]|nr:hypothetical protein [Bacillota bacterium]